MIGTTDFAKTFKARAAVIADQAHNPRGALGEGADFMRGLDENERKRESPYHSLRTPLIKRGSVPRCA